MNSLGVPNNSAILASNIFNLTILNSIVAYGSLLERESKNYNENINGIALQIIPAVGKLLLIGCLSISKLSIIGAGIVVLAGFAWSTGNEKIQAISTIFIKILNLAQTGDCLMILASAPLTNSSSIFALINFYSLVSQFSTILNQNPLRA